MYCYNVGHISFLDQQLLNITEANKQKLTFKVAYKHIFISSAKNGKSPLFFLVCSSFEDL